MYMYICICMYVCIYIYITYIHTYIHTYNTPGPEHRKIAAYRVLSTRTRAGVLSARAGDRVDGHGTHIAGSIAGSVEVQGGEVSAEEVAELGRHDGVAAGARLCVDDFSDDESDDIVLPDSLEDGLWPHCHGVGARVHSNSWGDDNPGYIMHLRIYI